MAISFQIFLELIFIHNKDPVFEAVRSKPFTNRADWPDTGNVCWSIHCYSAHLQRHGGKLQEATISITFFFMTPSHFFRIVMNQNDFTLNVFPLLQRDSKFNILFVFRVA